MRRANHSGTSGPGQGGSGARRGSGGAGYLVDRVWRPSGMFKGFLSWLEGRLGHPVDVVVRSEDIEVRLDPLS